MDAAPTATRASPTMTPSSPGVSARMSMQPRRDTRPEIAVRRVLHRMGLRFRLDVAVGPDRRRRVDVVFPRARVAVFVDGCFWHCCPEHGTRPKSNSNWWAKKLDGNVSRDRETDRLLADDGWAVVRVWEHEDPEKAAERVAAVVLAPRA